MSTDNVPIWRYTTVTANQNEQKKNEITPAVLFLNPIDILVTIQ